MIAVRYVDTSVLVSAYLGAESAHTVCRRILLEDEEPVVTSALALVEFASALHSAERGGRLSSTARTAVSDAFAADCYTGPIDVLEFEPLSILDARDVVEQHNVRTLDALHLVAAQLHHNELLDGRSERSLQFVTRDAKQGVAARALGMECIDLAERADRGLH